MENLRISAVQTPLIWENTQANLEQIEPKIIALQGQTDLVILPEMFTTGFSMNTKLAETMDGTAIQWMATIAKQIDTVITGSLMIKDDGKFYNRLIWMFPDGSFQQYDKKHLFSLTDEPSTFTAGKERLVVSYKGWRICPLICYDIRFPVWARNQEEYDILIYVANFPQRRSYAWKQLLIARAIENMSYTIGVNIVGKDGNGIDYSGDSSIINPLGVVMETATTDTVLTADLDYNLLQKTRKKYPFLADGDTFSYL